MIRVAAVGDVHFAGDTAGMLRPYLENIKEEADVLLLAGDLTLRGEAGEAKALAHELKGTRIPVVAVLGNHDYHLGEELECRRILEDAGIEVLEGESRVFEIADFKLGIAGLKGFGGGFYGACGTEFGEPEMKMFIGHTRECAERLDAALTELVADVRVVLLHYAPIKDTLHGERPEIYPFLGSYLLAEPADRAHVDLIIHGHAHNGVEKGVSPGGLPVRNVAQPVIRRAFNVYSIDPTSDRRLAAAGPLSSSSDRRY